MELNNESDEIVSVLRSAILASNPAITEHVKWNAPSFCFAGEDRVTFRLKTKDGSVQLIFHRGAKVKDASDFEFKDSSGLFKWLADDRAVVSLVDLNDAKAKSEALVTVINEWMRATT